MAENDFRRREGKNFFCLSRLRFGRCQKETDFSLYFNFPQFCFAAHFVSHLPPIVQ